MKKDSLKCAARRHNHQISKNQLLYKEETEAFKIEYQTSVLSIIYSTTINGGRPKDSTLRNKKNIQGIMDEVKLYKTIFFLEETKNFQCLSTGTFHILHNYVMTKYGLQDASLSIPVDTIMGRAKY